MKDKAIADFVGDKELRDKFVRANPNPVLSSGLDGGLQFVNPAALKLMHDLGLEQVEELLPAGHKGLVKACLKTDTTLTEECQLGDRTIVWSYQPTNEKGIIYIYGYDVTVYQSKFSEAKSLPEANPNPVLIYNMEGTALFKNCAVTLLLNALKLENVEDILPVNHDELVDACIETRVPVTEERYTCGRSLVWSYQLSDNRDDIYIYGYDVTDHQSREFGSSEFPEVNPSPVLTSGTDGRLRYKNHASTQLLLELGLDNIEDILPNDHIGMIKACYSTNTSLKKQCLVAGRTLIWSYHPMEASDLVYIYGHDVTDYCTSTSAEED